MISTQTLEEFIKKVRSASRLRQKQITISIEEAENITHHLNLTLLKLVNKYQNAEAKKEAEGEVITVSMDGGGFEETR